MNNVRNNPNLYRARMRNRNGFGGNTFFPRQGNVGFPGGNQQLYRVPQESTGLIHLDDSMNIGTLILPGCFL